MFDCSERYNASEVLDRNLEAGRQSRVAIYYRDEQVSHGQLHANVCAMGRALQTYRTDQRQRVLLVHDDTPVFPIAFFGAIRIGAVPVTPLFKAEDCRYRMDVDGFYWYEGRSDDMIKVGGEWVSPIAIENVLLEHPVVHEVAVVGMPTEAIMRIQASIVCTSDQDDAPVLVAELQQWCKARLQRYQ